MRYSTCFKVIALASMPFLVAACGGGSGGPGGPGGTVPSYTSLNSMTGAGTKRINGIGREGKNNIFNSSSSPEEYYEAFSSVAANSVEVTNDADGKITAITLNTPSGSRSLDSSNASELIRDKDKAEGYRDVAVRGLVKDDDGVAIVDPIAEGFEYQTFGMWNKTTSESPTGTTAISGVFSIGSETAEADIPTSGTATFKGRTFAQWNDSEGNDQDTMSADATLQADFAKRSVAFNTTNSALSLRGAYPGLDMNGTLSYGSGNNNLSGAVSTVDGMTGTVDGRFYGPGVKEIGGVFSVSGNGYESLYGGFGAVRQ